jgi:hypothetical protein
MVLSLVFACAQECFVLHFKHQDASQHPLLLAPFVFLQAYCLAQAALAGGLACTMLLLQQCSNCSQGGGALGIPSSCQLVTAPPKC